MSIGPSEAIRARQNAENLGVDPSRITLHGGERGSHSLDLRSGSNNEGVWEEERRIYFTDGSKGYDEPLPLAYGAGKVWRMLLTDCTYLIEVVTHSTPHGDLVGFPGIQVHIWDGVNPDTISSILSTLNATAVAQAA